MPYYRWRGVDLNAQIRKGVHFSRSENELDCFLIEKEIALLKAKQIPVRLERSVSLPQKVTFFEHLCMLLQAGIALPQALRLVGDRLTHKYFGLVVQNIAQAVDDGVALPDAVGHFPKLFNPVIVTMLSTGFETGNLALACQYLADYLAAKSQLKKKIRSAVMMPLVTVSFFLVISALLILVLVPRFAQLLVSMQRTVPSTTQKLLNLSQALASSYGIAAIFGILFLACLSIRIIISSKGKQAAHRLIIKIPILKQLAYWSDIGAYFHSLGVLLTGGMPLLPALELASHSMSNSVLIFHMNTITAQVGQGYSLSHAFATHSAPLVDNDILNIIYVAEETGTMGPLLGKIGQQYYERFYHRLNVITTLIQPILMIFLGILITALIVALYMPIFNLSYGF